MLAGCGAATSAGKFHGDESNVARTIDAYSSDGQGHDTAKICNQVFTPQLASKLGNCRSVVSSQLNSADSFDLTVQSVKISGASAQARVKSTANGKDRFDTLLLAHGSDGRWRISGLVAN